MGKRLKYDEKRPFTNFTKTQITNEYTYKDSYLQSAFCERDSIQWFFITTKEIGFSDFEYCSCDVCGGDLIKDGSRAGFSGFSEVVGCLIKKRSNKTLYLVVFQSCSQEIINALRSHLKKQSFTDFEKVIVLESGMTLSRYHQEKENIALMRKKLLSTATQLFTIQIKRTKRQKQDRDTQISAVVKESLTRQRKQKRSQKQNYSESAKETLRRLDEDTPILSKQSDHKLNNLKKHTTESMLKDLGTGLDRLRRYLKKNLSIKEVYPKPLSVILKFYPLDRMGREHLPYKKNWGIGENFKEKS